MGLRTVDVVASPKFHKTEAGVGVVVLVKLTGSLTQTVKGAVNEACIKLITTALVFTKVLVQPVLLVTVNVTVKLPVEL